MSAGPLIASGGLLLGLRIGQTPGYFSELLPAVGVFALGLTMTVAPLTTTVLAGVESHSEGIASAINNAVARIAGLLGTAGDRGARRRPLRHKLHARLRGTHAGLWSPRGGRCRPTTRARPSIRTRYLPPRRATRSRAPRTPRRSRASTSGSSSLPGCLLSVAAIGVAGSATRRGRAPRRSEGRRSTLSGVCRYPAALPGLRVPVLPDDLVGRGRPRSRGRCRSPRRARRHLGARSRASAG